MTSNAVPYDLAILNGSVYTQGTFINTNLYIKDGKIHTLSKAIYNASKEYDACGNMVLPGFIDPHVHFNLQLKNACSADDFYSGSVTAAFGGITTIIDFLDPVYGVDEIEAAFSSRLHAAKSSIIDFSFHATLANPKDEPMDFIKEIRKFGIPDVKIFTTYSDTNRQTPDSYIKKLMKSSSDQGFLILIHAENDQLIKKGNHFNELVLARPLEAETTKVLQLCSFTKELGGLVYIVHLSGGSTLEKIKADYSGLLHHQLFIESCPHYFYLDSSLLSQKNGYLYTMAPPIRETKENSKLKANFNDISVMGTDHCPFKIAEKNKPSLSDIPMGVGGVEHSFTLMYTMFGNQAIDKFTINPAKLHGLFPSKGVIMPNSDADLVIFNPDKPHMLEGWHSNCDYDPYRHIPVNGKVMTTISRGRFVVKDGMFVAKGKGEFLKRRMPFTS